MNITDNRTKMPKVEFKELSNGTVFEDSGVMCMVIAPVENVIGNTICNAVTLSRGLPKYFNSNCMVTPLHCRLVVEDA